MKPLRSWDDLDTTSTTSYFSMEGMVRQAVHFSPVNRGGQIVSSGMCPSGRTVRDFGLWPDELLYALRSKGWRPTELEWSGKTPEGRNTRTWCIAYMDAGGFTALFQQGDHDWRIASTANPGNPDHKFRPDEIHKVIEWINTNS